MIFALIKPLLTFSAESAPWVNYQRFGKRYPGTQAQKDGQARKSAHKLQHPVVDADHFQR
jgi:hypothetical protein